MAGTAVSAGVGSSGNVWLEGILWGTRWDSPGARTVVSTYIAGGATGSYDVEAVNLQGTSVTATAPSAGERAAMIAAMNVVEQVCNIDFRLVGSQARADLIWASTNDADAEGGLGLATPPGTEHGAHGDEQSIVVVNYEAYDPSNGGALVRGGYDFCTYIHELGHAVGLAHPHDTGGGSTIWPGVGSEFGDLGHLGMNQGLFTMMGYNDGWLTAPHGVTPSQVFGWQAGPMAIDIAALQLMYGANASHRAGDDTYTLPGANQQGTFFSCIWDAGGTDLLRGTARADTIDLRAATLEQAPGGGGWASYAAGIHGGFTIARGAVIENAAGGAGNDRLQGNTAANDLRGEGGDDRLRGGAGADSIRGADGRDVLAGGDGRDALSGGDGSDLFVFTATSQSQGVGRDTILDFRAGKDRIVVFAIDADANAAGDQDFRLDRGGAFAAGEVRQTATGGGLLLEFNADGDGEAEMSVLLSGVTKPLGAADFDL